MKPLIVFDLDGTLTNTIASITHHINKTLLAHGFSPVETERVRELVGNSSRYLVEHILEDAHSGYDEEEIDRFTAEYNQSYESDPIEKTSLYPGVREGLQGLKSDFCLGIASNKPEEIVRPIVSHFFPERLFDSVIGFRREIPRKPDPACLYVLAKEIGAKKEEMIYVGDSEVDAILGQRAEVCTYLVDYGFRSREELVKYPSEGIFSSFEELVEQIRRHRREQ